jgi:hypothetical protein
MLSRSFQWNTQIFVGRDHGVHVLGGSGSGAPRVAGPEGRRCSIRSRRFVTSKIGNKGIGNRTPGCLTNASRGFDRHPIPYSLIVGVLLGLAEVLLNLALGRLDLALTFSLSSPVISAAASRILPSASFAAPVTPFLTPSSGDLRTCALLLMRVASTADRFAVPVPQSSAVKASVVPR